VLIVGAGMSGIGAAYYMQKNCAEKSYRILESRSCQGGTWSLFQYPGIRSDSDMYTFGKNKNYCNSILIMSTQGTLSSRGLTSHPSQAASPFWIIPTRHLVNMELINKLPTTHP
jgi:hypothetical protein